VIPIAKPDLGCAESKCVNECLKSGWISSKGQFIDMFEEKFANFCGTKYATSCCNGTAALHLALLSLGIEKGDEVLVPDLTFISTANAVKYCQAVPVLVDVEPTSWNMDPEQLSKKITSRTKAIIPVHLYGVPCDMDKIMQIAKEHDLFVVEDCAEAHGAEYQGKKVGTFGDVGCFSFFANKIITTGEGGMCVSNKGELIDKINVLKNHGMSGQKKYWHDCVGFNYRLTSMQAAVGLAQLGRISEFLEKRKKIEKWYKKNLSKDPDIHFQSAPSGSNPVCWMFSMLLCDKDGLKKANIIKKLENKGIDTRPVFYPLSTMPPYFQTDNYPNSAKISKQGLTLPTYTELTEEDVNLICDIILT
jgi:perosamine synthetase